MKCPKYDFHIHTKYMGCANATMEVPAIVRECERLGVVSLAMTDHLYCPDDLARHDSIRRDIQRLRPQAEVYFGLELNFSGRDEGFPVTREMMEQHGVQFAIGGIHGTYLEEYDLKKLVDIQHRHHLKACRDELVSVLVHPYWFGRGEFDKNGWPWFDSMKAVPESHARELGQAARDTNTAIEINSSANLTNPAHGEDFVKEYVEYLSIIADEGAAFSLGSDAHDIGNLSTIQAAWNVARQLGLSEDRIWRPPGRPIVGGKPPD